MADWRVVVAPVEEHRFCVLLFDVAGTQIRGPDGGDDNRGYMVDELRKVLRDRYKLSETQIVERIEAAERQRREEAKGNDF